MLTSTAAFQGTITTVISDTVELSQEARGFYLETDGDISFVCSDDSIVTGTFKAGYHIWNIKQIRATGTTAAANTILLGY